MRLFSLIGPNFSKPARRKLRSGASPSIPPRLESLEMRVNMSMGMGSVFYPPVSPPPITTAPIVTQAPPSSAPLVNHFSAIHHKAFQHISSNGTVVKSPHFYEIYTGPQTPGLNVVKSTAQFNKRLDEFVFTAKMQGPIDLNLMSDFAFGIDRGGSMRPGPFPNRPGIVFNAVVVANVNPGSAPDGLVVDLAGNTTTPLPAGDVNISGSTVRVVVPGQDLPSTGSPVARFRYNLWPEVSVRPQDISSFAPEFTDAPIGVVGRRG